MFLFFINQGSLVIKYLHWLFYFVIFHQLTITDWLLFEFKYLPFIKLQQSCHLKCFNNINQNQLSSKMLSFSTDDYIEPEWSSLPKYTYQYPIKLFLQIIKQGSIIGNISIKHKAFILIGRDNDLCDLCINNPSVSRKHAILQFKNNESYPYLYDLGGVHGTQVNHHKLPTRAYEKLKPFDILKFGISSRYYVLRCPLLEQQEQEHEAEEDNKFQQLLSERKKQLSKQELKQKYLNMIYNDPYYKVNNGSRMLQGVESAPNDTCLGVDWGISDENEVYAYRSSTEFQLEPDILRRLPGLDNVQLNKISEYETNFLKYSQVESQLNQLINKQKKQYGISQKLRDNKEKLQKKLIETTQELEKSQDWIRVNIFGEVSFKIATKQKAQKENDSFEDDEFVDRTLSAKRDRKQQIQNNQQSEVNNLKEQQIFTTQDYWKLQKQLRNELKVLISLQKQQKNRNQKKVINTQEFSHQVLADGPNQQKQDQDDLEAFMKQNNINLEKQQSCLTHRRIQEHHQKIKQITSYLTPLVGQSQIIRIQNEERGICEEKLTYQQEKLKKQQENKNRISDVLRKLDIIREQEEEIDEEDVRIFDYYRNGFKNEDNQEDLNEGQHQLDTANKRERPVELKTEHRQYQKPCTKHFSVNPRQKEPNRDADHEQSERNDQFEDLTNLHE